jgi:hypothetical protein
VLMCSCRARGRSSNLSTLGAVGFLKLSHALLGPGQQGWACHRSRAAGNLGGLFYARFRLAAGFGR